MDTVGLVRDLSGTRGAANLANGARGELAPAARDAFAELDSAPASGTVTWTHASPRQAEAGFEDPVLGWVGVRAEMSGGAVHAAVVPGSAEAAQELGRQMEGLHSYLAEQRTPVESLSMASAGGRGGDPGSGQPMQQNAQGQGSEQQGSRDSQALPAIRGAVREIPTLTADSGQITTVDRSVSLDFQAGSNISVMA
jgi:hypothetical protein